MACKECGSKTVHKAACSLQPGGPRKRPEKPAAKGQAETREAPRAPARARSVAVDPARLTVEQLVATIEACRSELGRRKDDLREQLAQVEQAMGAAA